MDFINLKASLICIVVILLLFLISKISILDEWTRNVIIFLIGVGILLLSIVIFQRMQGTYILTQGQTIDFKTSAGHAIKVALNGIQLPATPSAPPVFYLGISYKDKDFSQSWDPTASTKTIGSNNSDGGFTLKILNFDNSSLELMVRKNYAPVNRLWIFLPLILLLELGGYFLFTQGFVLKWVAKEDKQLFLNTANRYKLMWVPNKLNIKNEFRGEYKGYSLKLAHELWYYEFFPPLGLPQEVLVVETGLGRLKKQMPPILIYTQEKNVYKKNKIFDSMESYTTQEGLIIKTNNMQFYQPIIDSMAQEIKFILEGGGSAVRIDQDNLIYSKTSEYKNLTYSTFNLSGEKLDDVINLLVKFADQAR